MELGNLKLCTKFEVASFSHCKIFMKKKFLGSSVAQGHYSFFLGVIFTARRSYASAVLVIVILFVRMFVRLSVRPSRAWFVTKRNNILPIF